MKIKNQKWLVAAVAAGVCLTSAALRANDNDSDSSKTGRGGASKLETSGQASTSTRDQSRSGSQTSDTKFLEDAAKGGQAEVKMGELAQQKGQSEAVKQFGQRLTKDHQEANQKLQKIADRKGISQPTDLGEHQRHLDHLSQLNGEEFDKAFIDHAVNDHKKDVKKFEKQASEGEDPAIRSFARETLPKLQEHLKIAQQLKDNPNASIPELNEPAGAESKSSSDQNKSQDQNQQQQDQNQQQQQNDSSQKSDQSQQPQQSNP